MTWLWWAVDLLASEYGWAKDAITQGVYLDELYFLIDQINKRKISEYKMQLAIAQNPHVKDPKALWEILNRQTRKLPSSKLDVSGMELLKSKLRQSPSIDVK